MTATDAATEVVADIAEEFADSAQHVADISRATSGRGLGLAFGAFLIGTGVGGGLAYIFANRRLETKYQQIAEDEIQEMREHFRAKTRAQESEAAKRPVEELVKERGYSSPDVDTSKPPMAVQPPENIAVETKSDPRNDASMGENEVEGPNGVKSPIERNVFRSANENVEWDWDTEKGSRSDKKPYVIHRDERYESPEYSDVSLTYYAADDVVCNERDEIIDPADRDRQFGEKNLDRFGHGSGDPSIVYIRNDELEIVYEIVHSPNSYAQEVHGFTHEAYYRGNLERMRARERYEQDE